MLFVAGNSLHKSEMAWGGGGDLGSFWSAAAAYLGEKDTLKRAIRQEKETQEMSLKLQTT